MSGSHERPTHTRQVIASLVAAALIALSTVLAVTSRLGPGVETREREEEQEELLEQREERVEEREELRDDRQDNGGSG
jgi:hypothetical protein